jgi:hypothetical protein
MGRYMINDGADRFTVRDDRAQSSPVVCRWQPLLSSSTKAAAFAIPARITRMMR